MIQQEDIAVDIGMVVVGIEKELSCTLEVIQSGSY